MSDHNANPDPEASGTLPETPADETLDPAGREPKTPLRRCLVSGVSKPKEQLIRFVLAPDDSVMPDLAQRLPGRGVWISDERAAIETATRKGGFSRAARRQIKVAPDLAERVATAQRERVLALLGLARRAGGVVTGFEKTRAALADRQAGLLVEAADGAEDGRFRLRGLANGLPRLDLLPAEALSQALGTTGPCVHAAVLLSADSGRIAARLVAEAGRLARLSLPVETASRVADAASSARARQRPRG